MSAEPSRCTMQRHKQLTLQRCKTNKASNARHPIFKNYIGFSTGWKSYLFRFYVDGYTTKVYNIYVCLIENLERKD